MRIAVHLPRCRPDATAEATRAFAHVAEELGYARIWAWEQPDAQVDPVAALAFVAGSTDRVPLGAVVRTADRPAATLARALTTLHDLGAGRVTVGLDREEASEAVVDVLPPPPLGGPPLLLSADGPDQLDEVARRADGLLVDDRLSPEAIRTAREALRRRAAEVGRDPDALAVVALATVDLDGAPTAARPWRLAGPPAHVVHALDDLRRAGIDEVVLAVAHRCGLDATLDAFAVLADAAGLASADALRGPGST